MLAAEARRAIAARLERGTGSRAARLCARAWQRLADPVRPVELPRGARVIGIGGATLGGSGKTPLAGALARALAAHERVALAASAYGARPGRPRRVRLDDSASLVGDEALALARMLAPCGVAVVVAPRRREALAHAAEHAPLVVSDGLLQTRPVPLALSVLALDARAPWGAGACPPAGDLRAEPRRLLEAADLVLLGSYGDAGSARWTVLDGRRVLVWRSRLLGARTPEGGLTSIQSLRGLSLGLSLAVARPDRVVSELAAHAIRPAVTVCGADHARPTPGRRKIAGLDAWLTTPKCATKLGPSLAGRPVWVLEHAIELPRELVAASLRPLDSRSGALRPSSAAR